MLRGTQAPRRLSCDHVTSPGLFPSGSARECGTTLSASLVEAHRSRDGRHRRFHPRHRPRVRRRQAPRRAPRAQPWCASHPASADETTNASVRWPQKSLWIGPARATPSPTRASLPSRSVSRVSARAFASHGATVSTPRASPRASPDHVSDSSASPLRSSPLPRAVVAPRAGPARRMMAISTETEAEAEVSKALKEGGVTGSTSAKSEGDGQFFNSSSTTGWRPRCGWTGRINGRWTVFGLRG